VTVAHEPDAAPAPGRADRFQRRHRWAGFPLAVLYKFIDDQGSYLSALIAYYGFLSLFPLLLLLVTILGFVLHGDPGLQHRVLSSTLAQFPVGQQLSANITSAKGSGLGLVVGVLGSLYGGLGVAQAGQNAMNTVWAVPKHRRPNPFKARLRSLGLLMVLGTSVLLTTVLSGISSGNDAFGVDLGAFSRVLVLLLSFAANLIVFIGAFRVLTARHIGTRTVLPGAVGAAVGWQLLQTLVTYYAAHELKHASQVYGLFGLVLGLVGWIYLEAIIVVFCAEVNAVRARRLWPRSLLTPFTDAVALTPADRSAYASYAAAQANKGFETVDVGFDQEAYPAEGPPVEDEHVPS